MEVVFHIKDASSDGSYCTAKHETFGSSWDQQAIPELDCGIQGRTFRDGSMVEGHVLDSEPLERLGVETQTQVSVVGNVTHGV